MVSLTEPPAFSMEIKKRYKNHNGIDFTMYVTDQIYRGEAVLGNKKLHLTGIPSLTKAIGQYKYGDEVIVQIYNKSGSVIEKERLNENYDRIQIFFPLEIFKEMCKSFMSDLNKTEGS